MGIANDMMEAVMEAQATARIAIAQRDELAAALRELADQFADLHAQRLSGFNVTKNNSYANAREILAKLGPSISESEDARRNA